MVIFVIYQEFQNNHLNNLDIHFTLDKNKNGNYNIEITDNKDNIFPDYYENGIVFLLYDNILYLNILYYHELR